MATLTWTVTDGEVVGTGNTPTRALADLRRKAPEYPVLQVGSRFATTSSESLVTNRKKGGARKMAVVTVKQVTSDLSGKAINPDDVVKVSITFGKDRKRFELDAAADEVLDFVEKGREVGVRGRKPENGKAPAGKK